MSTNDPSGPALQSLTAYREFRQRIDAMTAGAWKQYKDKMQCRPGCSACCRGDFRISLVEGLEIKLAVAQLSPEAQARIAENLKTPDPTRCPLLINGQCGIYAERPILCRVFGFPMSDGETITTCELNFQDERDESFTAKSFNQQAIGEVLTTTARLYLAETGQALPQDEPPPRFLIQEILHG